MNSNFEFNLTNIECYQISIMSLCLCLVCPKELKLVVSRITPFFFKKKKENVNSTGKLQKRLQTNMATNVNGATSTT